MAHREFDDFEGTRWDVWEVVPTRVERRREPTHDPVLDERRSHEELRVRLGSNLADGWLCFESNREKRRLAPIPQGWESGDGSSLARLCAGATVVKAHPRTD